CRLESYVTPTLTFNADETLLNVSTNADLRCLKMLDPLRKAHQSKRMSLNTVGSMTPFVNAAGEVYLIVYCLKAPEGRVTEFCIDSEPSRRKVHTPRILFDRTNVISCAKMVISMNITVSRRRGI